ncbi:helix-turn-helix protein [Kribbella amoyensis]|uniref:Helix-turn-helix protein n=1 Tax=Kribbella amoyensis TaxID=996641 RepID=A0A561C0Q1_9ACTN|nr:helix-turn-helix transcriptional regulator [Kribbella amoyensis]TWD84746.1 helix-turn-helix protein [Kribbella amoyensis]
MDNDSDRIGAEIRRLRKWRGMTLDALAGQAGMSKGYLSKIENGTTNLERRATIKALADALRVSVVDLTGDHFIADRANSDAHAAIPDIRIALMATTLDLPHGQSKRPVEELALETQRLAEARINCQDTVVGRGLPPLLTDLHATATADTNDRRPALQSLVQATNSTAHFLKNLGAVDLAWVAAERGHQAAQLLEDPIYIAAADYARAQALVGLGAYERADAIARNAASLLTLDSAPAIEIYAQNILTAAFCSSLGGDDPADAIEEARELSEKIETTNAFWLNFSRSNVNLWRLSMALEAGDHVKAAEVAALVDPKDIPSKTRKLRFYIDNARALHGLRRNDGDVVQLLHKAEKLGATRARHNVWAREIVTEMLLRARRDAGGRELRSLADRMGLLHAT